jgi:hypothetical protein
MLVGPGPLKNSSVCIGQREVQFFHAQLSMMTTTPNPGGECSLDAWGLV